MKSASTAAITNAIKLKLKSTQCYSHTKITYFNDDGVETIFRDALFPISIKKSGEPPKYANINYIPASAKVSFKALNMNGVYSPKNTDSDLHNVLIRDRRFRFYDAKYLWDETVDETESADLSDAFMFFMKYESGNIVLDIANNGGNRDTNFNDLFNLYGSGNYGSVLFTPEGYMKVTFDRDFPFETTFNSFSITCNNTNGYVYYKFGYDEDEMDITSTSASWTYAGQTINGTQTYTVDNKRARFLQVAVLSATGKWGSGFAVSDITLSYTRHVDWILLGEFLLDDPTFNDEQSPKISNVKIIGRNAWKRALDTEINIFDISGQSLTDVIKDVADQANLTYTSSSIANLDAFGVRSLASGYDEVKKVSEIFNHIMQIIGHTYRIRVSDNNVLYVEPRPTEYLADWVFNFKRYKEAKQRFIGDKQLQSFTLVTKDETLTETQLLGSVTFFSTGSGKTVTWSDRAINEYFTVTTGSPGGSVTVDDVEFYNESAVFTLSGEFGAATINVYGTKFDSTEPDYSGEAISVSNLENKEGLTAQEENPLVISDAECKTISENFIDEFGSPEYEVTLEDTFLNPFIEANDMVLVVSEDFFEDSLYEVTGVEYKLSRETRKTSIFYLSDTGQKFTDDGPIIYDRDYFDRDIPKLQYDIGFIYDSRFRIGVTRSEILSEVTYPTNVGMVS